jgi:hypothetical protein
MSFVCNTTTVTHGSNDVTATRDQQRFISISLRKRGCDKEGSHGDTFEQENVTCMIHFLIAYCTTALQL